jgi:hypothetical protein
MGTLPPQEDISNAHWPQGQWQISACGMIGQMKNVEIDIHSYPRTVFSALEQH